MAAVIGINTKPEICVRGALHSLGYRYRLHRKDLPGKPDIALAPYRVVIFVHGCFWHMHGCRRGKSTPKTNAKFWRIKRTETKRRDRRAISALRKDGWTVFIVWECQTRDVLKLRRRVSTFMRCACD